MRTDLLGFVVGMSRAGTTWMSQSLNAHPEIAVFGETGYWGRNYIAPVGQCYDADQLRTVEQRLLASSLKATNACANFGGVEQVVKDVIAACLQEGAQPTPIALFERVATEVGSRDGKRWVLEKTPHHINWIVRILKARPDARFIVMTREPYGFMRSYKHNGDRKSEDARRRFQQNYHPVGVAIIYRSYLRSIHDVMQSYPKQVLLIEYEQVKLNPGRTLDSVLAFLGLDSQPGLAMDRTNSSFEGTAPPPLTASDVYWMNRIAGAAILRHGYRLQPVPAGALVASWLSLFPWSVHILRGLFSRSLAAQPWEYIKRFFS